MSQIPEEWIDIELGEYLFLKNGYAFKSKDYIEKSNHTVPVIRISDLDGQVASDLKASHVHQDNKAEGFEVFRGDLLIAMSGATTGKVGVYEGSFPAYQNQRVGNLKLHSKENGSDEFKNFLISSLSEEILDIAYGGAQPNISGKAIEALPFPLPPLAEQKEIARRLDELLAQVDTLKARLDNIPAILKRFRQSVLAAAVSGKLTEEWREENELQISDFSDDWKWDDIPSSWQIKIYSELFESRLGKMLDKNKNTGVPTKYLGNINVRWFIFSLDDLQDILVSEKEKVELSLQQGDVLICEGGEPGRCAIWQNSTKDPIVFQKALHRARALGSMTSKLLSYNLKNDADRNTLDQLFTGTTIKHLTGKALKMYPLRVPPLEEQTEIVRRVEQLFAFADKIEEKVNNAQTRVDKLTQSILKKAFQGDLTAEWREQNPDLISGENSAEALLERIKAEREKLKPVKKTRRKSKA